MSGSFISFFFGMSDTTKMSNKFNATLSESLGRDFFK